MYINPTTNINKTITVFYYVKVKKMINLEFVEDVYDIINNLENYLKYDDYYNFVVDDIYNLCVLVNLSSSS